MAEGNLKNWNAIARPPQEALKKITGGRLTGMTDISPQWRLKAMTEQFGPIGEGWGYDIVDMSLAEVGDEVVATVKIDLWWGEDHHSPGVGSSKILEIEKAGPHVNDEAWKMALTDALSVAMKQLGMAADIYMGKWDGSKYKDDAPTPDDKAAAVDEMYNRLRKVIDDKKLDGALDENAHQKAVAWLDGHARTITGMKAAERKLAERFSDA